MKQAIVTFTALLLFSCSGPKTNMYLQELKGEGGLFRGIDLRDGYKSVIANENQKNLIVDEKVYLRYEYKFDEQQPQKGNYKVEYYFDGEDQLHEMIYDIFITDKSESDKVYKALVSDFTSTYGEPTKNHEGYLIWQGKTENTNKLEVALLDESALTEGSGYISLQFNDFDY